MKRLFLKTGIMFGSIIIMFFVGISIIFVYAAKFLRLKSFISKKRDFFHDSRRYPLNDPNAPRG